MMVLPQLLEHFHTDQAAWLNASAMLAGALWSPLLAKSSDIFGKRRILIGTLLLAAARGIRRGTAALTRVASSGSMIVNSSRGGGAKDTWILR